MGERLGRYTLEKKIAAGGMAEIYLARQDGSNNTCVIKRMLPELMVDPQFTRMFLDEAKLVAQLHHPQIATIYDFGHQNGVLFLAMEHVDGGNLRAIVKDNARKGTWMTPHHAAAIVAQAARALDYAHQAVTLDNQPLHLIHRDVSPQNILLGKDGMVKLIDFGVAKTDAATQRTAAGMIKGKFAYMSPEQIRGQALDGRSDLFGLGLVLYELLANMRAVPGVSDAEMAQNALAMRITPIATVRPDMPSPLARSLNKVLQRDRNLRHARGIELALELEAYVKQAAPRYHPLELAQLLPGVSPPSNPSLNPFHQPKMALATPAMPGPHSAAMMQATVQMPPAQVQGEIRRRAVTIDGPTLPPSAGEQMPVAATLPGMMPGVPQEEMGHSEPTDRMFIAKTLVQPQGRSAPSPVISEPNVRVASGSFASHEPRPPAAPAPVMMSAPKPQSAKHAKPDDVLTPSLQRSVRPSRGPWIAIAVVFGVGLGLIAWTLLRAPDRPLAPPPKPPLNGNVVPVGDPKPAPPAPAAVKHAEEAPPPPVAPPPFPAPKIVPVKAAPAPSKPKEGAVEPEVAAPPAAAPPQRPTQ